MQWIGDGIQVYVMSDRSGQQTVILTGGKSYREILAASKQTMH
jgi:hypothetical protein